MHRKEFANMKVNCHVHSPNFVGERGGGKPHGHVILLDLFNFPNNFLFKQSLRTCFLNNCVKKKSNNLFKSNKTTNFNQKKNSF